MKKRIESLICLRFIALTLVVYQHISSNIKGIVDLPTDIYGINAGQFGVALFCVLSGYLSANKIDSISKWIFNRFWKIFPSYWAILFISFAGNYIVGYKEISLNSFFFQLLGLSYFIPPILRLNVATWFITLILFNYAIVIIINIIQNDRNQIYFTIVFLLILALPLYWKFHVGFFGHVLAFISGYYYSKNSANNNSNCSILVLIFYNLLLIYFGLESRYALLSIIFLIVFIKHRVHANEIIIFISNLSYEIFLLHGLFIVFFIRIYNIHTIVSIILSISLTILVSLQLRIFSNKTKLFFSRKFSNQTFI